MRARARVALEEALKVLAETEGACTATPSRIVEIVKDYTDARKHLPIGAALAEASEFFGKRHPTNMPKK